MRFERTDDSHRSSDLRPRQQIRKVPPQAGAVLEETWFRRDADEQGSRILIQVAPVVLEYRQSVFAVSQKKVEKRRGGVKRISQNQIERTWIRADHAHQ